MHEALTALGVVGDGEASDNAGWAGWLGELARAGRATRLRLRDDASVAEPGRWVDATRDAEPARSLGDAAGAAPGLWVAAERLAQVRDLYPGAVRRARDRRAGRNTPRASRRATRRCASCCGRASAGSARPAPQTLATSLVLPRRDVENALVALQSEGFVLQGRFTPTLPAGAEVEWCERHLLARIHRYTLKRLRREIEPVEPRDFARFLFEWQRVGPASRVSGPDALAGVLGQLEGFEAPAAAWEARSWRRA
jgi:ATP-dependent Lhr-like helicase